MSAPGTPDTPEFAAPAADLLEAFIERWQHTSGTERANYQLFLTELCTLLGLPQPEPASADTEENAYVFERRVDISSPDGSNNRGFIDLYKRGCFVLEAKQTGRGLDTEGWDKAMLAAHTQADRYIRALSSTEGRPPFLIVTDVGRSLEFYAEFTRSGGTYVPYPDPGHHRIRLTDLREPAIQERLFQLWHNPDALDPSKYSARVTRELSRTLADLARLLEQDGFDVERVAHFLKRCLFTMFSEDVDLIPKGQFTALLERLKATPEHFPDAIRSLWETMNSGGYSGVLNSQILRFNGGLFQNINPIPLKAEQIQLLIDAARHDWSMVEPAIFGTLLERALDPRERHKLGAHYTPRAYVERLVMPTLIDPLREEWRIVQVAAQAWLQQGKQDKALDELRDFRHHLCQIRVLDPACGSGNFLYVALEHMKRLEGEVQNLISDLSGGQLAMEASGLTVDPHQFLGLELNPRAAAIAEIVLWIGYLQWHYRIHRRLELPEPILRDTHNIENRDALIEYDSREPMQDEHGKPITIWDGISYKQSPITGELIPDEEQRIPVYHYSNPRKAEWPETDYIIGNPPFIGAKRMRALLGDGYVDAVQEAWPEVPQSTDFVLRWWHHAADLVKTGKVKRFGFITTNSIKQTYIRRAVEPHMKGKNAISLVFAVPDHPWVDATDGASVRIAMTVGEKGERTGILLRVITETKSEDDEDLVRTTDREIGKIGSDLTVGPNIAGADSLVANSSICSVGMKTIGSAFQIEYEKTIEIGLGDKPGLENYIKPYVNGRDFTSTRRGIYVIDFFGVDEEVVKQRYPRVYQYLYTHAKPERIHNRNKIFREKWWVIGHPRQEFRNFTSDISRYIATVETMKHRFFGFFSKDDMPDSTLVTFGLESGTQLGILSSRIHVVWALATGGRLGMGNDPRYNKTRCFETFPFPEVTEAQANTIGELAEKIDAHRKRQQAEHPELTLTGMYNVLEKIRSSEPLSVKDKTIHEQGLVSLLRELHDDLDRAVFEAYGWQDLADKLVGLPGATTPLPDKPAAQAEAEEELLMRLVELNTQRAAEEAQGHIRWLRPEYQSPEQAPTQTSAPFEQQQTEASPAASTTGKQTWPKTMPEQVRAVRDLLAIGPQTADALAEHFKRKPTKAIEQVLAALEVLGQAHQEERIWQGV